ncbi:MAG: GTPase Era [Bacteroidota bacterium]
MSTDLISAPESHKAGFVSIIGRPNAGKSTLMNALIGEQLSIVTSKAQTTRHRIFGILNGDDFQVVYSDTPGILAPHYELQRSMMRFVNAALEDADVVLLVIDLADTDEAPDEEMLTKLRRITVPIVLVLNKSDMVNQAAIAAQTEQWAEFKPAATIVVSALKKTNTKAVLPALLELLPQHPPYFPKDELTDKSERFFASEIIREKLLLNYHQEIPYSCEVVVTAFKEKADITVIQAEILVERMSQRAIIIGHQGAGLKKVGMEARKDLEAFFGKKIFLETHVKVEPDWRSKADKLAKFGYNPKD